MVEPFSVKTYIKCLTAEHGYSIGDKVIITGWISDSGTDNRGHAIMVSNASIYVRFGANATIYNGLNKSTSVSVSFTNTSWALVVEAES